MAVYAISDLHGRMDLFQQVKDFLQPEDIVYVLGDCGDRGPAGWELIKTVYEDPQFIYLMGNHEDMLVDAMRGDRKLCFYNGGKDTFKTWKYKDGGSMAWATKLSKLPKEAIYTNANGEKIILCHSGYTPHEGLYLTKNDYIWSRDHFLDDWDEDIENTYMIHGHTPIVYMDKYMYSRSNKLELGAFWYCKDKNGIERKCNIDCGAVFLGFTVLLDLDTFDEHIFMAKDCVFADEIDD